MNESGPSCAVFGGLLALTVSVSFLLFGNLDLFGGPEPDWARTLFWPGIFVGVLTWDWVSHSMPVIYAAGVLTMTLIGAALGALLDLLRRLADRSAAG